jgi:hypothetical protein
LLPELSGNILEKMAAEMNINSIHVTMGPGGFVFEFN